MVVALNSRVDLSLPYGLKRNVAALDSALLCADPTTPGSSRRSSVYPAVYPTTSRRCSQAVAAYAATGDLEAVAEILKGDKDPDPDEEDFVMPPEKERKKLVLLISCIGLTMTFMAAIMVGITLGLSHVIEEKVIRKSSFKLMYTCCFLF